MTNKRPLNPNVPFRKQAAYSLARGIMTVPFVINVMTLESLERNNQPMTNGRLLAFSG